MLRTTMLILVTLLAVGNLRAEVKVEKTAYKG